MNKLYLALALALLLVIPMTSALDWDNVKSYDEDTKIITITNAFGLGGTLAKMQLITPQNNNVIDRGNGVFQRVAEVKIIERDKDVEKALGKVDIYNAKNMNKQTRAVKLKYKIQTGIETIDYIESDCDTYQTEGCSSNPATKENPIYDWIEFSEVNEIPEGVDTIGIYVDVIKGEQGEWIPNKWFGEEIDEWATWTEGLNTDIVFYYTLNDTGTTGVDSVNGYDITIDDNETAGLIGLAHKVNAENPDTGYNPNGLSEITFNMWINRTGEAICDSGAPRGYVSHGGGNGEGEWMLQCYNVLGGTYGMSLRQHDGSGDKATGWFTIPPDNWVMITVTQNNTAGCLYFNSSLQECVAFDGSNPQANQNVILFSNEGLAEDIKNIDVDETSLWNRTLSSTEISDLYNDGVGITYRTVFNVAPTVNITYPLNTTYTSLISELNYTVTDAENNEQSCDYSLDLGVTNISVGTIGTNVTGLTSNIGSNIWEVYCNDSEGELGRSSITFVFSPINPNMTIDAPLNQTYTSVQDTISFTESGSDACWYSIDGGATNTTTSCASDVTGLDSGQGTSTWLIAGNTTLGGRNESYVTFIVDTVQPTISIKYPVSGTTYNSGAVTSNDVVVGLNWTVADTHLSSCWYYNQSANVSVTCGVNASLTLPFGTYTHIVYANDTFNNPVEAKSTGTYIYSLLENSQSFNTTSVETAIEGFKLNITYNPSTYFSSTALLIYNGTRHTSTSYSDGVNTIYSSSINIPLVASGEQQNKTFLWQIGLATGSTIEYYNTSSVYQNISRMRVEFCNTTYTDNSLNFTAHYEKNLTRIPFSFDASLEFWAGDGSVKRTQAFSNSSSSQLELCIVPSSTDLKLSGTIEYDSSTNETSFNKRTYDVNELVINSNVQNIKLLLLEADDSTSFIQYVIDGLSDVANALIKTYRYYPGTNEWIITQITTTDDNGKTVGFYKEETVDYRHEIYTGTTLRLNETVGRKIFGESTPFTLIFQIGSEQGTPPQVLEVVDDLTYSLTYNELTDVITFTYTDTNVSFNSGNLTVFKQEYSKSNTVICSTQSTLDSALINCNISGLSGSFISTGYNTRDNKQVLVIQKTFVNDTAKENLGTFGFIIGIFIIMTAALLFLGNEIAGIIAVDIAIFFVNLFGLIRFGGTGLFAVFAVSIIVIWGLSKK